LAQSPQAGVSARLEQRLVGFIDSAVTSLVVVAPQIRSMGVLAALGDAEARGLEVCILEPPRAPAPYRVVVRDQKTVWTGTASFTPTALHDQNVDCLLIDSPWVARRYLLAFEVTAGRPLLIGDGSDRGAGSSGPEPAILSDGELFPLLNGEPDALKDLIAMIQRATRIRILASALSDPGLLTALRQRWREGADIAGIYDVDAMTSVVTASRRDRGQFWFVRDPAFAAITNESSDFSYVDPIIRMLFILDGNVVITGCYGQNSSGACNQEVATVIRSLNVAAAYEQYWQTLAEALRQPTAVDR
jgi:hypothetical protein